MIRFIAAALILIGVLGLILARVFPGAEALKAIEISAAVAFVIQVLTFRAVVPPKGRPDLPGGMLMRWGAGAVVRLFSLLLYGLVATKLLGLPAAPALVSLAAFFFVTMLAEPLMLTNAS
ncbi:MAG: hypothetical protein H0W63_00105 [Gemmatimonadaceae bacterium]|nr:hypothetical protein [Gemmatimonadaceae bacterium]